MKDGFISMIAAMRRNPSEYAKLADRRIITDLMRDNLWGKDKLEGCALDESYEMESKSRTPFIPGHIAVFIYKAGNGTKVLIDGREICIEDRMPVVLCMGIRNACLYGANLNMCDQGLRTALLNEFYNMDYKYYTSTVPAQAARGNAPVSPIIAQAFNSMDAQEKFAEHFCNKYGIKQKMLAFRTYSICKIKNPRLVEAWAWKYVPFLEYGGGMKKGELRLAQECLRRG